MPKKNQIATGTGLKDLMGKCCTKQCYYPFRLFTS